MPQARSGRCDQCLPRSLSSYDRLNHLLSLNIDKVWRRYTIGRLRDILQRPETRVLDLRSRNSRFDAGTRALCEAELGVISATRCW
jgi:hypothetical protein